MRVASLFVIGCVCLAPAALTACGSSSNNGGGGSGGSATGGASGAAGASGAGGAAGGAGGAAGSGGMAGAGGAPQGQPISAPDKTWTWVPFADAHCRDGSTTGIGVNLNSASDKVVIYLEGGGACFNSALCAPLNNPDHFGESDFNSRKGSLAGIFDRSQAANPLKDWNYVYVPYCTGDVHAGNNPKGSVPGVAATQMFVGYVDVGLYLSRLVPTFANASQVLLTGASAGGFGSAANYLRTQQAFGSVPVDLLDDSGPPMSNKTIPACFLTKLRTLWNFDATILKDCGSNCPDKTDYLSELVQYAAQKYPTRQLGLVSSVADGTIRGFLSFGENNCTYGNVTAQQYQQGLMDLRTSLQSHSNFGSYYIGQCADTPCSHHTWIMDNSTFYGTTVGGTSMPAWVGALVSGNISNVGP